MSRSLTAEAAAQLQEGINLVLSRWAALRMAVENEWGGRDSVHKSQQLPLDIFNLLTQSKERVYIEDVEEMLDEFMLYLNTEIDDGSVEEVAEKLMVMHEECSEGNFDSIQKLRETNVPRVPIIRQPNVNDDEDSEDEGGDGENALGENNSSEMEVEPSRKETPETIDGWTVVAPRRNRGKKV